MVSCWQAALVPLVKVCQGLVLAGLGLLVMNQAVARAGDIETRDFNVHVDHKPAGEAHMTINRQDDGTTTMSCDTDVLVRYLLIKYKYSYRGQEIWKDGRLQRFESNCDDDGKRYAITAIAEGAGVRVRVNRQERVVRPEVWLSSYWALPDAKVRSQVIPIMDADNGRDLDGRLQHIGTQQMNVAGQVTTVNHYRLTGTVRVDLWYDTTDRLVRQEWVEEGHHTMLELTRVWR
jgi:hypothetical protein